MGYRNDSVISSNTAEDGRTRSGPMLHSGSAGMSMSSCSDSREGSTYMRPVKNSCSFW